MPFRRAQTRRRSVGQTSCRSVFGGTHRRDLRRPKGSRSVDEKSLQQFQACMDNVSQPLLAAMQFRRAGGAALATTEQGADPARSLSLRGHSTSSTGEISTPNWRDRMFHRAHRAKAAERPHANSSPPSIAGERPCVICRQSTSSWGQRGRAKLARIYHRRSTATGSSQNYRVMFRSSFHTSTSANPG